MDYLDALETPVAEVVLAGETVICAKGSLQLHYRLRNIAVKLLDEDPSVVLDASFDYIATATGMEDLSGVGVLELAPALDILLEMNESIDELAWQITMNTKAEKKEDDLKDYDNRSLAVIVHMLAKTYGWSDEYIFELQPEVAFAYIQEILISEHEEQEFAYRMTPDIAYNPKTGKYKPYPSLPWDTAIPDPTRHKPVMVPKQFMPGGVIIDLTKENGDAPVPEEE